MRQLATYHYLAFLGLTAAATGCLELDDSLTESGPDAGASWFDGERIELADKQAERERLAALGIHERSVAPAVSGPGVIFRTGGPDPGGYWFMDSSEPAGPRFFWRDITATGTELILSDDSAAPITIPFGFPFYGTSYSALWVGSNGTIHFQNDVLGWSNTPIPSPTSYSAQRFIAAYWDDLDPASHGEVYYQVQGSGTSRRLVVQWNNVPHYGKSGPAPTSALDTVSVQAILFEGSGNILMQYLNPSLEASAGATIGIQDSTTVGLQYSHDATGLSAGLAICYSPGVLSSLSCRLSGPDLAGYAFTDSGQPGAPQFYWRNIKSSGTPVSLTDDSISFPISLPFLFDFYGVDYSHISIGSNGTIDFSDGTIILNPPPILQGYEPHVAVYWDDLNPGAGGIVYYEVEGEQPKRRMIVQWDDIPHYAGSTGDTVTMQAILFEGTNNILLQYLDPSSERGTGGKIWIGPGGGVLGGISYSINEASLDQRRAICFTPPGGSSTGCSMAGWLSKKDPTNANTGADYYSRIGAPQTFALWKSSNGFGAGDVNATYYNDFDLGLGRDMHCRRNGSDVACYVTNYGIAPGGPAQPALNAAVARTNAIATVAMEYDASQSGSANDVRFYVYNSAGDLIERVALDSEGPKNVPQVCLSCHGGTYSTVTNDVTGSSFLPFDPFTYRFSEASTAHSRASQEDALRQLNHMVRDTNPSQAIIDLINGMYTDPNDSSASVTKPGTPARDDYVPSGWSSKSDLYAKVVKTSCRGCHLAQGFNLNSSSQMNIAENPVCKDHQMPHGEKPFKNFWTSSAPHQPTFLASQMGWSSCTP